MRIHLIACGGAVMHNMTIALHLKGNNVSGSDDEIYEPASSRLKRYGLLPEKTGWDPERITKDLDVVITGMHARPDNPELLRAKELGLKIYSFPEYIYESSKEKTRVVIGGSHGKTTTTAMIMHVLNSLEMDFDYMVGAQLQGFDTMVKLSSEAPLIILEGDEYTASPIDLRPKFHLYHANVALLTGIAWDHVNVFPTFEKYLEQFRIFINQLEEGAPLIYFADDSNIQKVVAERTSKPKLIPYTTPNHRIENGISIIEHEGKEFAMQIIGSHNLQNMEGARLVCKELGIDGFAFFNAMQNFTGASKRLELFKKNDTTTIFRDFAHSPSKLKATISGVRHQFPERKLIACFELHTFSSLDKNFIPQYAGCMDDATFAMVYFNEHTLKQKNRELDVVEVRNGFGPQVEVYTDAELMKKRIVELLKPGTNLLLMSSGTFNNTDFNNLI